MDDQALKLDNQVCFPLYACSRLVTQAYRPFLEDLGLTYPQYLVMMVLWEHDGLTVGEIGERLYLDSGTLTPLLKRLEKNDWLVRRRTEADERVVTVHLTKAGRALKGRARSVPGQLLCEAELDLDQLAQLKTQLHGLLDQLLEYRRQD